MSPSTPLHQACMVLGDIPSGSVARSTFLSFSSVGHAEKESPTGHDAYGQILKLERETPCRCAGDEHDHVYRA